MRRCVASIPGVLVCLAATAVFWLGATRGSTVAAGADSYGYISQARLWLEGTLRTEQRVVLEFPPAIRDEAVAPLGYRPARLVGRPGAIVPTYAPGLPLTMALFGAVGGERAMFLVVPVLAALAVIATWRLGLLVGGSSAAAPGALFLASSPAFVSQTLLPMSDVPAATWWTLALVGAATGTRRTALFGGLAAACAILTRPNLAPAVVPIVVTFGMLAVEPARRRRAFTNGTIFLLAATVGVAAIGAINAYLYRSPFSSGYGSASDIYDVSRIASNTARYLGWLRQIEAPWWWLGLAAPLVLARRGRGAARTGCRTADDYAWPPLATFLAGLGLGLVVFAQYLLYLEFDEWSYLRFLLPAYPTLCVGGGVLLAHVARSAGPRAGVGIVGIATALAIASGVATGDRLNLFHRYEGFERYRLAGDAIAADLPARTILIAMEHSGTGRYYGKRFTVRYDMIEPAELDLAIDGLRRAGFEPYFLLEDWEEPIFRRRFAVASPAHGRLDVAPLRVWPTSPEVHLYSAR